MELCQFPLPHLGLHEALVRVRCCTLCGSDLHTVTGKRTEKSPSILGHEILGEVVEVGNPPARDLAGEPLRAGERVTWSTSVSCGGCDRCLRGLPQKCRSLAKYGHEVAEGRLALAGGLAEYIVLRAGSAVVKLPADVADEVLCPVNCATATVCAALRTAGDISAQRVLILGAGMLGLTATAAAHIRGARFIAVADRDRERLTRAVKFGASHTVPWLVDAAEFRDRCLTGCESEVGASDGFDVILELSGSPEAVEAALSLGAIGARVVLVGSVMKSRPVSFDPEFLVRRWMTVSGVHNYAPRDLQSAVALLVESRDRYPFADLVEQTFSLAEINTAVERAVQSHPIRIAIRP